MHLLQILMDLRAVCIILPAVAGLIILIARLADQVDDVEAESPDAFLHPELQDLLDLPAQIFILPV